MAVLKRSYVVLFTEQGFCVRPPGTRREPVRRHAWPNSSGDKGMVSVWARPILGDTLRA